MYPPTALCVWVRMFWVDLRAVGMAWKGIIVVGIVVVVGIGHDSRWCYLRGRRGVAVPLALSSWLAWKDSRSGILWVGRCFCNLQSSAIYISLCQVPQRYHPFDSFVMSTLPSL